MFKKGKKHEVNIELVEFKKKVITTIEIEINKCRLKHFVFQEKKNKQKTHKNEN